MAEEQELDRLYGLPLDAFVGARDEAVRALRRTGDPGAAERMAALRKPSLSAWAVNQLARRHPGRLDRLLRSGERLRAAHRAALARGGRAGLADTTRTMRATVSELVDAAVGALEEAGRPASEAVRGRIAGTLLAAARGQQGAELVRKGRLVRDLDPSGPAFGDLATGATEQAGTRRPSDDTAARERRQARRRARDEAGRQASAAADAAVLARRQAEGLRHAADRAEQAAAQAREAADAAAEAEQATRERATRKAAVLDDAEALLAE